LVHLTQLLLVLAELAPLQQQAEAAVILVLLLLALPLLVAVAAAQATLRGHFPALAAVLAAAAYHRQARGELVVLLHQAKVMLAAHQLLLTHILRAAAVQEPPVAQIAQDKLAPAV
jgi:hypothetical protein